MKDWYKELYKEFQIDPKILGSDKPMTATEIQLRQKESNMKLGKLIEKWLKRLYNDRQDG